jgi:hypothetical protein
VLADGWPVAAQGSVAIDELSARRREAVAWGSYELVFPAATTDDGLHARLSDTDGPLAVSGELVLAAGRSFDLQGFVAKRGSERTPFDSAIEMLGLARPIRSPALGLSGTFVGTAASIGHSRHADSNGK